MKAAIIGYKGMLGRALVEQFTLKGCEVLSLDKDDLDITSENQVLNKISQLKPDIVINAAAYNAVDLIESDTDKFELAKKVNGMAVGYLAQACAENNITLVHYSSDYVFEGKNKNGYLENSVVSPISKYGETKAMGEKLLVESGANYYLVRLSRLFGPMGEGKKSFVDLILNLANKQTELRVVAEEYSCPTYSKDLAEFTLNLWKEKSPFGIYHGANDEACTWYEFAVEILKKKNLKNHIVPVTSKEFHRSAKRPAFSKILNSKMPKQRSWVAALNEFLSTF